MDDFETAMEEAIVYEVEIANKSGAWRYDDKLQQMKTASRGWAKRVVLEIESTSGEDVRKIVEKTTQNLGYYINIGDKVASGFERIDSSFERSSTVGKMLSNNIACCREIVYERKNQAMPQASLLFYFKKLPKPP